MIPKETAKAAHNDKELLILPFLLLENVRGEPDSAYKGVCKLVS